MPRGFVLFGDHFAYVGIVASVASARHPRAALAPKLFVPSKIGVVLTDPPDAKTNGTHLIHPALYIVSSPWLKLAKRDVLHVVPPGTNRPRLS